MSAFIQGIIDQPEELYGRKACLDRLLTYAKRGEGVNLVGARRSGKTCILHTLVSVIKQSAPTIYPILIDIKESDIVSDTDAVYRYFLAKTISLLNADGYYCDQNLVLAGITVCSSEYYEDIYDAPELKSISGAKVQSMFQSLVGKINQELGKSVLLLLDEYEVLLKYAFNEPAGFYKLRNLADNRKFKFSFIVAGHEKWDRLITDLGSGELNGIVAEEDVYPISREAFHEMWNHECSLIDDPQVRTKLSELEEFAHDKSGGIPFYAKVIGSHVLVKEKLPNYTDLSFEEILQSLSYEEKLTFSKLCFGEDVQTSPYTESLLAKGLIANSNGSYKVTIGFLKDYFESHKLDAQLKADFKLPCQRLAETVSGLIKTINYNHTQNGMGNVFEYVNDSDKLFMDMGNLAYDEDQFTLFTIALYQTIFQRTATIVKDKQGNDKKNISKGRLPKSWSDSDFVQSVDIFRHSFGRGHEMDGFVQLPNKITLPQALKRYTGKGLRPNPYVPEEWITLQEKILKEFISELEKLLDKVNNQDWS